MHMKGFLSFYFLSKREGAVDEEIYILVTEEKEEGKEKMQSVLFDL